MQPDDLRSPELRTALEALRDVLIESIADAGPKETAALAGRLESVLLRLSALAPPEESSVDDLARRRAERQAAVSDGAGVEVKRGS